MGGLFSIFHKNRPQNHQKGAILHTSQANGGGLEPPPVATLLVARRLRVPRRWTVQTLNQNL